MSQNNVLCWLCAYVRFLSIKLIVFATFWQDLLILFLSYMGLINWNSLQTAIVDNRNASLISAGLVGADPCVDDWGNFLCADVPLNPVSDYDYAAQPLEEATAGGSSTGFAEFASTALQDFLITFEARVLVFFKSPKCFFILSVDLTIRAAPFQMFLAALAHSYVFSYEEFKIDYIPKKTGQRR